MHLEHAKQVREITFLAEIVKMLIEGVDELGKVPLDVGVASNSLKAGSKVVTETQSQDNMLHAGGGGDPLPDSKAAVRKSSVTTSISGEHREALFRVR